MCFKWKGQRVKFNRLQFFLPQHSNVIQRYIFYAVDAASINSPHSLVSYVK